MYARIAIMIMRLIKSIVMTREDTFFDIAYTPFLLYLSLVQVKQREKANDKAFCVAEGLGAWNI